MEDRLVKILNIPFFSGSVSALIDRTIHGGLIVVPSAPVLVEMESDPAQRAALEACDLAVPDSGFLVLLLRLLRSQQLRRISGLQYLTALLDRGEFRKTGATFWVMPSEADSRANCAWLASRSIDVGPQGRYIAPIYPIGPLSDSVLLAQVELARPRFVIICIGGGVQERLGFFLRQNLSFRPAILCTGAAIAFLSGQQVHIPVWADRMRMGWLLRSLHSPTKFIPRYFRAFRLIFVLLRQG